jgi:hypothetical protein
MSARTGLRNLVAGSGVARRAWGAKIRSCSSPVLVEEPAEQVTSLYPGLATLVDEVQTNGWTWRLQPERPMRSMRSMRVVVLDVDPEHLSKWLGPTISSQSRHSARTDAIHLSANAFALGAWSGVRSTAAPCDQNTSSKPRQNFASRSRSRNRTRRPCSPSTIMRLRALLGDPGAVGVGGHSGQVDDAGVVFDEEQHVQPS